MIEFISFQKIPRLSREIVVTEKIDGTNGLIELRPYDLMCGCVNGIEVHTNAGHFDMLVGSRTRWITPEQDNYGFARWAYEHKEELSKLGAGRHFGEWWGQGIGRNYGMKEKRFSLFNTHRWDGVDTRPACCHVVPILGSGLLDTSPLPGTDKSISDYYIDYLKTHGSAAAPGFMNPEGIIIYHTAGNLYFKKTIEKDEAPKGNRS